MEFTLHQQIKEQMGIGSMEIMLEKINKFSKILWPI
jgi:hypothetical protein